MINAIFENLVRDIISQTDIIFSVKNTGGICEARLQTGMEFKIKEDWATIGNEICPWHIHLNMNEVETVKFVREFNTNHNRNSYSIRFFDSQDNLIMRANFSKLYNSNGNIIKEKVSKFENLFEKYGNKEILSLKD